MEQLAQATNTIRAALLNGKHLTSAEMNKLGRTVDSRKIVSRLRKNNMPINSYWQNVEGRRFKRYYCAGWAVERTKNPPAGTGGER